MRARLAYMGFNARRGAGFILYSIKLLKRTVRKVRESKARITTSKVITYLTSK